MPVHPVNPIPPVFPSFVAPTPHPLKSWLDTARARRFACRVSVSELSLSRRLDLTVLRPDASRADLERLCAEARKLACQAVCVSGSRVELVASLLDESPVKVSALIGFPFGAADSDVKRYEIEAAVDAGAQEFDVVINPGWVKDGADAVLLRELRDLREAAEERPVKAIVEVGLLTFDEVRRAAALIVEAELQFLVTGTGCGGHLMTPDEIVSLREAIGPELGLKAVGGVSSREAAEALIAAGANRFGAFDPAPFRATE